MPAFSFLICFLVASFANSADSQIDLIQSAHVKIKARLQVVPDESQFLIQEIELFETYSNADGRSLIEIKSPYNENRTLNFYATKDGTTIEHSPRTATCRLVDSKVYLEALFGPLASQKIELIDQWASPLESVPDHWIGLGRLLALIQRAKNIEPVESRFKQYIRGKESYGYTFSLQWASNLQLGIYSFYSDRWDNGTGRGHPIRVMVKFEGRGLFVLDVHAIESTRPKCHTAVDGLDATTLPLGVGCASVQKARLAEKVPPKAVFTMDVEFLEPGSAVRNQFIAHDANQQALRRDTTLKSAFNSVYLKSICDLKKGRQYNMNFQFRDAPVPQEDTGQPILQVDQMSRQCVAAELEGNDYEALLPFERLAYAGTGLVRGREVDIYEMSSATLPALFFPPGRFVDRNNKWHLHETKDSQRDQEYRVVYYFAGDGAHVEEPFTGSLVQVDVFRNRQLIKHINVFNFIWQLVEAPNGDPVEGLFSLHHSCSSVFATGNRQLTYTADRSIHMSMELQFLLTAPQNGNSNLLAALQSSPVRNAAILRGLVAPSKSLSAVELVGLRSFWRTSSNANQSSQHSLLLSSQIVLTDDDFVRAKMVSYGMIYARMPPIESLSNFEECFIEASRRRRSGRVLFAFTATGCYIDDQPIFETQPVDGFGGGGDASFTYSNIFRLEKNETAVRVMQVEMVENVKSKQSKQLAWLQIKNELMLQSITLPLITPQSMGEIMTRGFFFRVSRMEMHDKLEGQKTSDALALDGLGLQSGHKLTKPAERMDAITCKSACLKDMECKSYSICLYGRELECVLSRADIGRSKDLAELEEQRERLTRSQKPSSFELKVQSDEVDQTIALKLDRRCRLFRKLPIEMFAELPKTRTSLNRKLITQVESEQECADKCLQMNVKYLKDVPGSSSNPKQVDDPIKAKWNLRRNLKNWCAIFKFFDLNSTLSSRNLVEHGVLGGVKRRGLCLLPRRLIHDGQEVREEDDLVIDSKVSLDMDTFTFSYINLYESRDGLRLTPYPNSDGATDVSTSENSSPVNNRKVIEMKSIEECARACFMQTSGLQPSCKSFETVQFEELELEDFGDNRPSRMVFCVFNSMSLADAEQSGVYEKIVTIKSDPQAVVKHYEPRQGYLLNDQILGQFLVPRSRLKSPTEVVPKLNFSLLILIMVALVSGFIAGVKLKEPIVRLWFERHDVPIRPRRLSQNSLKL